MSIVYCGAPIHIYMQHLTPRQTLRSTYIYIALLCIRWGLVQDFKIKKEIPIEIKILSMIPKLRRISPQSFVLRKYKKFHQKSQLKILKEKFAVSQHTRFEVSQNKGQLPSDNYKIQMLGMCCSL